MNAVEIDSAELVELGLTHGLAAVGVTSALAFPEVQASLHERKEAGLHGGMAFTYRNPARSTDPARTLESAQTLVVGAYDFRRAAPPQPTSDPHGRVASYVWDNHYEALAVGLQAMADHLTAAGYTARVVIDQNNLVDRAAAHRSGIGWWGKSSNILVPGAGSMVVLGTVVTDALIAATAAAPMADGCGPCTKCLDGCPTDAFVGPGVIDARRCLAWLVQAEGVFPREHRVALGNRLYGCDECQDVCPPNRVQFRRRAPEAEVRAWVAIVDLLERTDEELMADFGRWYIARRDPAYLRRNALVVLANIGDGADLRTADAVAAHLADPRPIVRAHAVWAAQRLGLPDLLDGVENDSDPLVVAELRAGADPGPH